jgi:raffinose/stachyose/melibiose transport system substrate-binding protein
MGSRFSRRTYLKGAAAAPLALSLPSIGARRGFSSVSAQEQPEISMWFNTTGGSAIAEAVIKAVIDPYNARGGPQVKATLQANNWDATRTALAGGAGPDLVGTPGPTYATELAKAGQLLPLDDVATSAGWNESIVPWALNLGKVDNALYSIPDEVETLVLYYNKTVFTENGWTPPTTMAELMTLSQTINDAGIIPFAHANQEWRPANEWFVGEFLNRGAGGPTAVYQALTGALPWTDANFADSLALLNQMQTSGWFMGGLDRYYTTPTADANASFGDGDSAMKIEGTWWIADGHTYFGEEAGNENDWDWVPVPSANGDAIFDLGIGSTLSINAKTKNPEAVADFMAYYFSPEAQASRAVQAGIAPGPVNIPADLLTGLDPRYAAILTALSASSTANNYGYTTWTFWPPKTDTYLIDNIEKVWAGDMELADYLAGMQTQFDAEKTEGTIPPIPAR